VTNSGISLAGAFQFEAKPPTAAISQAVSTLTSIGRLTERDVTALIKWLRKIALETPQEGQEFSCRVWVRQVVRLLEGQGVPECDDFDALEAEVLGYAEANRESVEQGAASSLLFSHSRIGYFSS